MATKAATVKKTRWKKEDKYVPSMEEAMVKDRLEQLFVQEAKLKPARGGIHASSISKDEKDFCIRAIVLSCFFHDPLRTDAGLGSRTLRIFSQGNAIHGKWQNMFKKLKIAFEIEKSRHDEDLNVHFTPDAFVKLLGKEWLVEIKSVNSGAFYAMHQPHPGARRQAQMYMHLSGRHQTIIIAENKDNQEIKVWIMLYDSEEAKVFVDRLKLIKRFRTIFEESERLPIRHAKCKTPLSGKAKRCAYVEMCFATKLQRRRALAKKEG